MVAKNPLILSHITHRGIDCIRIDFAYNQDILRILKDFKSLRWSQANKSWLIANDKGILNDLKKRLEKVSSVTYIPIEAKNQSAQLNSHSSFMTQPLLEYSSLFISYSLKDKVFVNTLNRYLTANGVKTFLWEKDAPAGMPLLNIMFENVHKYDRVLFIASAHSLKSEACHYELSQAREKQDKIWVTIIFPIHIDNFLFEVRKENIRPIEKSDEYWSNICELRRINSMNFIEENLYSKEANFEKKVLTLLEYLKHN